MECVTLVVIRTKSGSHDMCWVQDQSVRAEYTKCCNASSFQGEDNSVQSSKHRETTVQDSLKTPAKCMRPSSYVRPRHEDSGKLRPHKPNRTGLTADRKSRRRQSCSVPSKRVSHQRGWPQESNIIPQRGSAKPVRRYGVTLTIVCLDSCRECSG